MQNKPVILITAGDPLGIGPETAVKAVKDSRVRKACRPVIIGERDSLLKAGFGQSLSPSFFVSCGFPLKTKKHGPDKSAGLLSFKAVKLAVKLALGKRAGPTSLKLRRACAVVTGPICKKSWALADAGFTGHTEFLKSACGADELLMSFVSGSLKTALITEHLPVKRLSQAVSAEKIISKCLLFSGALKKLGIRRPNIALCSLNPHAGDCGILGGEERDIMIPAVKKLNSMGIKISEPMPPDSAWLKHIKGEFDGVAAVYHDQALMPIKIAAKTPIVHWTCGLPFIRTSPAHGTAFDIAGKGKADPSGMIEAVLFAAKILRGR